VCGIFQWTNPLHASQFQSVRHMEAECVQWTVNLFNGDKNAVGCMTSGGTESILMALKAYRDYGIDNCITHPEMIMPTTAHPAFMKGAYYFGITVRQIPVDPVTFKVNPTDVRNAISANTICIIGSAPNYPYGTVDPLEELSDIAVKYGVPLHVDCCLGGFVLAFLEKGGRECPKFDFRLPGVTSISADIHKYGFAPKGVSVVMYRESKWRSYQYFSFVNWPGGLYASPSITGSRPGNLIAGAWAAMKHFGLKGYIETAGKINQATLDLAAGINKIDGLYVLGTPNVCAVAFGSKKFDIFALYTKLKEKGWDLSALQFPSAIHLSLTYLQTQPGVVDKLIADLAALAAELLLDPKAAKTDNEASRLYGSTQTIKLRGLLADAAKSYFDVYYNLDKTEVKPSAH